VANEEWRSLFPGVKIINGDPRHSDHRTIIISTKKDEGGKRKASGGLAFHFEASWLKEDRCEEVVCDAWGEALQNGMSKSHDALRTMASCLQQWSDHVLGDLEKRRKYIKIELSVVERGN